MLAMFTTIGWFFKRVFWFVKDNWKIVLPIVAVIVIVLFLFSKCGSKPPTIDLEKVDKINRANETERKKELQAIIEENQEVIRTVDNRSAMTDVHVAERNREIDAKIKEADKAIIEAKKNGRDVTQEELECILVGNCGQ